LKSLLLINYLLIIKLDSNELMNGNNSKEMTQNSKGMKSILHEIRQLFQTAIRESFPKLNNAPLLVTPSDHADYQCNSALPLSKFIGDKRLSPRDVANAIIEHLPQNQMIGSVVVAGPGFINITLNKDYVCNSVRDIVINGVRVNGLKESNSCERIVIDYSAPNIAKEMHVGHLRSTIIGDSIARLFEFVGYDVLRVNHIGDWGTQFGMLLAHLIELYPNYLTNPPPIADLQAFYKESKKRFDEDPDFKKRAYNTTVKLQAKEPDMITAWKQICDISRKEFQEVYRILDISKDLIERGESYYHELMVEVVKDLEQKQLLIEDEGRKVFFTSDKSLPPMTIVKSDGGFTYDTSDLATLRQRVEEEKASRIIYTVDAGQSQHFQILFNCAALAGYYDPKKVRVDHLAFGVVLGLFDSISL
jgi:arginyl-tRNA synthetase